MDCHTCSVDISRSEAIGIQLLSIESRHKHVKSLERDGERESKPRPWREAPSKHRRTAPIHPSPAPSPPQPHKFHLHTPQHHYLHSHSSPHLSHIHEALPPSPPPALPFGDAALPSHAQRRWVRKRLSVVKSQRSEEKAASPRRQRRRRLRAHRQR
jgi:hypothetical protein